MGFGDIAVNKKMKLFVRAFYGRLAQYSKSIDLLRDNGDISLLQETILNNIYKGKNTDEYKLQWFVDYMNKNIEHFINVTEKENLDNNFTFLKLN